MKILIATPSYKNQIHAKMAHSLIKATQKLKENNHSFNWDTQSTSILSYNRNTSTFHAIKDNYDWLLFWDSDISVQDDDFIQKMVGCAFKHDAVVIGLPIALKGNEKVYNYAKKTEKGYVNAKSLPNEPIEIDAIGCGVLLIKVSALNQDFPYFTFIDTFHNKPGFFPEDWNFCEKMKESGHKIFAIPIPTTHYGETEYS